MLAFTGSWEAILSDNTLSKEIAAGAYLELRCVFQLAPQTKLSDTELNRCSDVFQK